MRRIPLRGATLVLGAQFALPAEATHYARDVLRLKQDDLVEVFDADGTAFVARIADVGPPVEVVLERAIDRDATESPCRITLYQAVPRKERFEWLLEKVTELGVERVVPLETQRSVVRVPPNKATDRVERWQRICDEAARQCGRAQATSVEPPTTLDDALARPPHARELVLAPSAADAFGDAVPTTARDVALWIGPEGGFAPDELLALTARAVAVRLGPRVLRSETAGIVAASVVQAATGGLR